MPIIVNLDVMMAKRKISSGELAEKIGISPANLSILKTGKAKAIRFPPWRPSVSPGCQPEIFWNTSQARLRRIVEMNETGINNDEMDMISDNLLGSNLRQTQQQFLYLIKERLLLS